MDEVLRARHAEQTSALYAALGRFVAEFELVCWQMRMVILSVLQQAGLQNQQLAHVITADMTADPLRSIAQALIGEAMKLSAADLEVCDNIFKRIANATKTRNDVVHGTWFIGWAGSGDSDFSVASRMKQARGKRGVLHRSIDFTAEGIDALTVDCTQLKLDMTRLNACIVTNSGIARNFVQAADGNFVAPDQ